MLDGVEQCADRMTRSSGAKIIGGDMQVDLRARDQPMTEHIAERHQTNAGTYQVSCACVPQPMR